MNENGALKLTTSDEQLIEQTRAGDERAFAELWKRHFRSGARVARQFTSSLDADDLVSEAYTRIYQRVLAGGGPTGAFRPYLYTTIRNVASTWGAASKDVQVDDIADCEDPDTIDDPVAFALDRTLTVTAFRSLPERWQSVLWYTEVEGMDPHEVAPLMGMTANGVAALSYRAREGLRKAWLQAHVSDATASGDCRWTISRMGDHARNGLTAREAERMNAHLTTCDRCAIINEEVDEVGSRLALVMIPLLLGGAAGGTMLSTMSENGGALASVAFAIPAMPETVVAGGTAVAGGVAGLFAATAPAALVGALAIAVAITGGVIVNTHPEGGAARSDATSSDGGADDAALVTSTTDASAFGLDNPAHIPAGTGTVLQGVGGVVDSVVGGVGTVVGGVTSGLGSTVGGVVGGVGTVVGGVTSGVGGVVDDVVEPVVEAVVPPTVATVDVSLSGRGVPGATVTASVGGAVYASTVIGSNGTFSLTVAGVPQGSTVGLQQHLGGLLNILNIPLSLDSGVVGAVVSLLN